MSNRSTDERGEREKSFLDSDDESSDGETGQTDGILANQICQVIPGSEVQVLDL